jgi:hypothetical protein
MDAFTEAAGMGRICGRRERQRKKSSDEREQQQQSGGQALHCSPESDSSQVRTESLEDARL